MKKLLSSIAIPIALGLVVLTAATPANAQPSFHVRVSVPFPFLAGEQVRPAGDYWFHVNKDFKTLDLQAANETRLQRVPLKFTPVNRGKQPLETGFVSFQKLGDGYVLRGVWGGGMNTGFHTRPSAAEREMAKRNGGAAPSTAVAIQEM